MQPNCDLTRPPIWAHVVVLRLAQAPKTDGSWVQLKLSPIVFPLLWVDALKGIIEWRNKGHSWPGAKKW